MGVVPVLIFFHEASIHTFLYLALDFFNMFLWSGVGSTPHPHFLNLRSEFQVHLDQIFAISAGGELSSHSGEHCCP